MVAQDQATAWDLKPNRENTNKIFNILCNVQPVEHPRSGDWYARQIDVTTWSKDQFWFEKCKWLKKCTLYEYQCFSDSHWEYVKYVAPEEWDPEASSKKIRNEKLWENSNFTDVILFQWYRIYMRKNNVIVNPYWDLWDPNDDDSWRWYPWYPDWKRYVDWWWDWDEDTCDHKDKVRYSWYDTDRPSERLERFPTDRTVTTERLNDDRVNTFNTAWRIRIYIQLVDTNACTWDTFDWADEAPIVLVKEYEAAECNPDHFVMWYWWIWTPKKVNDITIASILYHWTPFAYIVPKKNDDWTYSIEHIASTDHVYIPKLWIYVTWLTKPDNKMEEILSDVWLELWWYVIPEVSDMASVWLLFPDSEEVDSNSSDSKDNKIWDIYVYPDFWEVPYFAAWNKLYSINWFFTLKDWEWCNIPNEKELEEEWKTLDDIIYWQWDYEDATWCQLNPVSEYQHKRLFIYDTIIDSATNNYVITWLTRWWARIAYISKWSLYVSWSWKFNWVFWKDPIDKTTDKVRGKITIPAWITDVKTVWWALVFFWPKCIFATANEDTLFAWVFVNWTDNEDWYYSPWSYYNDDWELLLARRWKVLWTLKIEVSYTNALSISFDPSTWFYVNTHIKSLNNDFDMINIDADINRRYVSIFDDNNVWDHYSKLLIYDKHYNCRYRRMITWARIIHVKDNIFLWDWVYVNKWRTRWWKDDDTEWWEIIEIISAYVWEEWLQTPKHIQFVKTAIWDHSIITQDSFRDIDTSYWWRLFERRNTITTTRYPRLLHLKNLTKPIETYEIGEEIYWHWKLLSHNLLNEISEYRNYDKFSEMIIREMWEEIDMKSKLALFASIKEPINAPANVLEMCISARKLDNVQFGSFYVWYYVLDPDYEDIENVNIDKTLLADTTKEQETVINKWEYCDEILAGSAC